MNYSSLPGNSAE